MNSPARPLSIASGSTRTGACAGRAYPEFPNPRVPSFPRTRRSPPRRPDGGIFARSADLPGKKGYNMAKYTADAAGALRRGRRRERRDPPSRALRGGGRVTRCRRGNGEGGNYLARYMTTEGAAEEGGTRSAPGASNWRGFLGLGTLRGRGTGQSRGASGLEPGEEGRGKSDRGLDKGRRMRASQGTGGRGRICGRLKGTRG